MSATPPSEAGLEQLAQLVETVSGNVVPQSFFPFLAEVARERYLARGFPDLVSYVKALAEGRLREEWRVLLAAITVKESSFFRTPQHFEALRTYIVPNLVRARVATRSLRLWSAGCARGEEAATLAMVLAEHPLLAGWDWRILATDVDEEALAAAQRGMYGDRAVASVPQELKTRYLTLQEGKWLLSERLLKRITYRPLNLVADPFPSFPQPFDIVMLRNVLIYFRLPSQRRVLASIARVLAPDGYLFLGPAETVWQVSDRFEPVDLGDCFVYRPRPSSPANVLPSTARPTKPSKKTLPPPNKKAQPLAKPVYHRQESTPTPDPFQEAVSLLVQGRLKQAAEEVGKVLQANPADAHAHALEGYLFEVAGEPEKAIAAFRACLYLEPELFQARLLLADALRRIGEIARAQAEYRQVLNTLGNGQGRELERLTALPLPTREQASRQALAALEWTQGR